MKIVLASIMKLVFLMVAALSGHAMSAASDSTRHRGVAAIKKVIQMLADMQAKSKKEKADEQVAFAEFNQWCKMETAKLEKSVKVSKAEIGELGTAIDKLKSEAKTLGEDVHKLQNQVAKHDADMKARKNTRAKEHAEYKEQSTDYAESVSALGRAIEVMSKQDYDRTGASAALLQVSSSSRVPQKTKDLIAAFLGYADDSEDDGFGDYAAPEANAYEFQSGSIVNVLKSLLDEFRAQKDKCAKEEANAKHAHDMVITDLTDAVSNAEKDASEKSSIKSKKEVKAAQNKKQQKSTQSVLAEDETTLKETQAECTEKKLSYEDKQQLRADEIEAISKAISIMSSSDVSSFIEQAAIVGQQLRASSFAQLRRTETAAQGRRHDVREFITKESKRLHSRSLSLLSQTLEADPFAKVKEMIRSMMEKLMKAATADAEKNGFCETEMGKSTITRTGLTEEIDSLTASIEDAKSTILSLSEDTAALSKSMADLRASMVESTKLRTDESKRNKETVADAEAAVTACAAATAVLKDFYEKASEATALVQGGGTMGERVSRRGIKMGSDDWDALGTAGGAPAPSGGHKAGTDTFGAVYNGNQDGATGVLAMIDVISSDFSNLVADTKSAEAEGIKTFEDFMVESKRNLAVKSRKVELNDADKAAAAKKLAEDSKDVRSNEDELAAAERYYEKLVSQCVAKGTSYEDRKAEREQEIQSLKEALKMLSTDADGI